MAAVLKNRARPPKAGGWHTGFNIYRSSGFAGPELRLRTNKMSRHLAMYYLLFRKKKRSVPWFRKNRFSALEMQIR